MGSKNGKIARNGKSPKRADSSSSPVETKKKQPSSLGMIPGGKLKQLSSLGQNPGSGSNIGNSKVRIDGLHCEQMCKEWIKEFKIKDGNETVTVDMVLKDALSLMRNWPRGDQAGQLLHKPEVSLAPMKERGVKLTWLLGAWHFMQANTQKHLISTRMFVECFVRPLLLGSNVSKQGDEGLTLLDFIPLQFRAAPSVFISHPWDGYFRHVLFYPDNVKKHWPADSAVWVDFFACSQMDDTPNGDQLLTVKETISSIGRTCVVFPGDGTPKFAILPVTRSWCVFEMLSTPKDAVDFRVGLHGDLNDVDFHTQVVELIEGLSVESTKATFSSDKNDIETSIASGLPLELSNKQLRDFTRTAFAKRYELVPTTPNMANRISNGSSRNSRGRINSMSDIYAGLETDEMQLTPPPDF